jgi:hypothetical protein
MDAEAGDAFANIAPPLSASVMAAVLCTALSILILISGDVGVVKGMCAVVVGAIASLAWSAVVFRRRWVYGLSMQNDGFEFRAPLRRPRFVSWHSITLVVASALHDELGESAITLHIKSSAGRAWITPWSKAYAPFLAKLSTLEGFSEKALSSAHVGEHELLRSVIPKRTIIFRRPANGAAV